MNQEKIIQAIAAYLEKETLYRQNGRQGVTTEFLNDYPTHSIAVSEYAHAIAAAIAPHMEARAEPKDYPFSELFDHMESEHNLILTDTELGDIIYISRK